MVCGKTMAEVLAADAGSDDAVLAAAAHRGRADLEGGNVAAGHRLQGRQQSGVELRLSEQLPNQSQSECVQLRFPIRGRKFAAFHLWMLSLALIFAVQPSHLVSVRVVSAPDHRPILRVAHPPQRQVWSGGQRAAGTAGLLRQHLSQPSVRPEDLLRGAQHIVAGGDDQSLCCLSHGLALTPVPVLS